MWRYQQGDAALHADCRRSGPMISRTWKRTTKVGVNGFE
jgi:hypothetical protein